MVLGSIHESAHALHRETHFQGKVHVAWGINDVHHVVVPSAGGGSRGDGDAALLLLHHPVHGGCAFVHLSNLVGAAGVVQDALSGGGLQNVTSCSVCVCVCVCVCTRESCSRKQLLIVQFLV